MNSYYAALEEYLKRLGFGSAMINDIKNCYHVRSYQKEEYFATCGETSNKIGFVISGIFYMNIIKQDGTIFAKQFMKKNDFLLAAFDPVSPSEVNIQSIKASVILEAEYSKMQALFQKYREMERSAGRRMEAEVERISKRMIQFATLEAKDRYRLFQEEFKELEGEIPQYLIASYLGVSPTQLSRIKIKLRKNNQHM